MRKWTIDVTAEDADIDITIDGRVLRVRWASPNETVRLFDPDDEFYGIDVYALEDSLTVEPTYYTTHQDALQIA